MPEWKNRVVIVEVEFEIGGSDSYGETVDQAVKPVEAIKGAKIRSARIENLHGSRRVVSSGL